MSIKQSQRLSNVADKQERATERKTRKEWCDGSAVSKDTFDFLIEKQCLEILSKQEALDKLKLTEIDGGNYWSFTSINPVTGRLQFDNFQVKTGGDPKYRSKKGSGSDCICLPVPKGTLSIEERIKQFGLIVVEGVKKAASVIDNSNYYAVSCLGVECFALTTKGGKVRTFLKYLVDIASESGKPVRLFPDSDIKTNENVLKAVKRAMPSYKEAKVEMEIVDSTSYDGKGIDDILSNTPMDERRAKLEEILQTTFDIDTLMRERTQTEGKENKSQTFKRLTAVREYYGKRLMWNELTHKPELDGKPINLNTWLTVLSETVGLDFSEVIASQCTLRVAQENSYHPIKQYLEKVHEEHCENLIPLDNLATELFGVSEPIYNVFLKKHLIASVARIFQPGCKVDTVFVLMGKQGFRKTTFFSTLYGKEWFTNTSNENDKDLLMQIHSNWCVEWGEIENVFSKRDISKIKGFLSSQKDDFRPPYGRNMETFKRQCVIVGSTNRDDFLNDTTGSRRFWVIPLEQQEININRVATLRDRIWASAVDAYFSDDDNTSQWWLTDTEQALSNELNKSYERTDSMEDSVLNYIDNEPWVTTTDILDKVLNIPMGAPHRRATEMQITDILKKHGWVKFTKEVRRKQFKAWRRYEVVREVVSSSNVDTASIPETPLPPYHLDLKDSGEKHQAPTQSNSGSSHNVQDKGSKVVRGKTEIPTQQASQTLTTSPDHLTALEQNALNYADEYADGMDNFNQLQPDEKFTYKDSGNNNGYRKRHTGKIYTVKRVHADGTIEAKETPDMFFSYQVERVQG